MDMTLSPCGGWVHVTQLSVLPLDRTAHGWKLLLRPMACFSDLLHGFKQVTACISDRRHPRSIKAAAVLQLILRVEAEEVGRTLRGIGACHFLGRIYNVGKAKTVMRCERSHIVEGVLGIALSVVWHDGDRPDADLA